MKVGLYFGSFNPIHIGHLAIANYIIEYTDMDQLWFIITPQNPLKKRNSLLEDYQSYELVYRAVSGYDYFRASNIEFTLPKPSYTIDTLTHIQERYPEHIFSLIMGADNLATFNKWKNADQILKYYSIYVYPRPNVDPGNLIEHESVTVVNAPIMEISASFVRKAIGEGKNIKAFIPHEAWQYLDEMNFYK